ncbi:24822_t:CDS:1 [Cetraspora pellucida]|uniref:24822_t:CDS:1 n=1 Tax=Cetraspora pellucida TaxID=1433469 RepID=A0A9N9EPZ8_9GLOM|nr:24822_t:CDS:1 [Cetraspora pellucida]
MKSSFITTIAAIFIALLSFEALTVSARTKCSGSCKNAKIKANGTQIKTGEDKSGFCSNLIQGQIPSNLKMVSSLIIHPTDGEEIQENKRFVVNVKVKHLNTGFFSDPNTEYYTIPQKLGKNGFINGHSHVTIQKLDGDEPPDPTKFAFFKGLNNKAKNNLLSVTVDGGLPCGSYRLCTMSSSFTHQPVIMPVAQRGSQDDCIRFKVVKK